MDEHEARQRGLGGARGVINAVLLTVATGLTVLLIAKFLW